MTSPFTPHEIEAGLQDLFKYAYVTNCTLEDEELTEEEKDTLEDLDSLEVLENFKDLVMDLLAFKREFRSSEKSELARRSEQFEGMLQKLESEVRNHIRVEQQLKLHLEAAQSRVEELEKKTDSTQLLTEIAAKEKELEELRNRSPVKDLELKLKHLEEKYKDEISRLTQQHKQGLHQRVLSLERDDRKHTRKPSDDRNQKLLEVAERRQKAMSRLESDLTKLKLALEDKNKELETVRRDYEKLAKEVFAYREKGKGRESETKPPLTDRENQRKPSGEIDQLFRKRQEVSPYKGGDKHEVTYTKQKLEIYQTYTHSESSKPSKKHTRTGSDRTWRPSSSSIKSRPASSLKD